VAGTSFDNEFSARVADDSRHHAERDAALGEHRTLLDVELEERSRQQVASRDERTATDASDLLPPKNDHRTAARLLDCFDRGDDS
jgi:hypothetical protein